MQNLIFESAWDKTIAPQDRAVIEKLYLETKNSTSNGITILPISQAFNHRDDLLVIVLIHNFSDEAFSFEKVSAVYMEADQVIAANDFSFPELKLDSHTSMPWTFIFPKEKQMVNPTLQNGNLIFK